LDRRISPNQNQRTSRTLRRYTAAPGPPPAGPTAPAENRSCVRKTSGPTASAKPAVPLAGRTGPALSGCQAFAPLHPASGSPPASPASARRSHSSVVPGSLASAVPGILVIHPRSSRRSPDSPGSLGLVSTLFSGSLAHILPPSPADFLPGPRILSSPRALRPLPPRLKELHSPLRTGRPVAPDFSAALHS